MEMKTAFPHQFLVDLTIFSKGINLPGFLKDLIRQQDIPDQQKLEEFFTQELPNAPLQSQETVDYFLFLSNQAIQLYFYRQDFDGFNHTLEILKHRMSSLRNVQNAEVNIAGWEQYLSLVDGAFQRLLRHVSIEAYESQIDSLDWTIFDKAFIASVSRIIGYVYLNEDNDDQANKSRLWLQKAIYESAFSHNLSNYLYTASYYLDRASNEHNKRLDMIIDTIDKGIGESIDSTIETYFKSALFELKARKLGVQFSNFDDNLTRLEHSQQQLRELELNYSKKQDLPTYSKVFLESTIAILYSELFKMTNDDLEQASFSKYALRHLDRALEQTENSQNDIDQMHCRQLKAEIAVRTNAPLTEKEVKENIQFFKKSNSYPYYIQTVDSYLKLLTRNETTHKTYDVILDILKQGNKRIDQGGFYLITKGLRLANNVFLRETGEPGVSWMIHQLDLFFDKIISIIENIDEHMDMIGKDLLETFRNEFKRFEPVSHFNAKVYLRYQLYELKMMRLGAKIHGDQLSLEIADNLINELENDNNPLAFIKAKWDEFKKVPNDVRNNTLNKCISISKGDLPLAAEHLDFSYRNLRSYITFKEVNRLGFFLNIQQTDNKQLEQGIRYMFYDLYKNGTIFEVVFDMPKFLVKYAKKGFYSQDLERELNIKGTTAKKYIKIMIEIKLIRQDKTTGRKHYYRLMRENVMKRLGKDLNTLISPQSEF